MGGYSFVGMNFWYVVCQVDGCWGELVYVDGVLNDGVMIYNFLVVVNGDIYFLVYCVDFGVVYQIYVVYLCVNGYLVFECQEFGEFVCNWMDLVIDLCGCFLIYVGDEGDLLGWVDFYIVFCQCDGCWGKFECLLGDISSSVLENVFLFGLYFGELYVVSNWCDLVSFFKLDDDMVLLQCWLYSLLNGLCNFWCFDIVDLLCVYGIEC